MSNQEKQYLDLLATVLQFGDLRKDRTGVGTKAVFGAQMRFDLAEGFPVFTTKRVYWKTAFKEMLLMLRGATELRDYLEQNVRIWTDWPLKRYRDATGETISQTDFEKRILSDDAFSKAWGSLGSSLYGATWRRWKTADGREIDQVQEVLSELRQNPTSRRMIIEGWNVGELHNMALPPCHKTYQFFVNLEKKTLSLALYCRSQDLLLGTPFNVCNAALLLSLVAHQTGYDVGEVVWFGADSHIYLNHKEAVEEQLSRQPRELPKLVIKRRAESLFDYTVDDLDLVGYDPHPPIKAEVAV